MLSLPSGAVDLDTAGSVVVAMSSLLLLRDLTIQFLFDFMKVEDTKVRR